MSINKFFVAGYVGADPECFEIGEGEKKGEVITTFSLAENIGTDKNGNDVTAWHRVSASGKLGTLVAERVKKGIKLVIEGRATAKAYMNKDHTVVPQINIWLSNFEFASSKDEAVTLNIESNSEPQ